MTESQEIEAITKDLKRIMPCTCLDAYKDRGMADPECSWCGYGEDIVDFIIKDRERIVEPLVFEIPNILNRESLDTAWALSRLLDASKKTLKLTGLEK